MGFFLNSAGENGIGALGSGIWKKIGLGNGIGIPHLPFEDHRDGFAKRPPNPRTIRVLRYEGIRVLGY